MGNNEPNRLPFTSEIFTKNIVNIKKFLHENIYNDPNCINILKGIIEEKLDPFFVTYIMETNGNRNFSIKLKKTNIKKLLNENIHTTCMKYSDMVSKCIYTEFFNNPYVKNKLNNCTNSFILSLNDPSFIELLFSINILSDNYLIIYL